MNLIESRKPAREFGKERLTGLNKLEPEVQALPELAQMPKSLR